MRVGHYLLVWCKDSGLVICACCLMCCPSMSLSHPSRPSSIPLPLLSPSLAPLLSRSAPLPLLSPPAPAPLPLLSRGRRGVGEERERSGRGAGESKLGISSTFVDKAKKRFCRSPERKRTCLLSHVIKESSSPSFRVVKL